MSNPFSATFMVQQHTPLIHFQHEQDGATLRATELKPKLDAYIISRLLKIPLSEVIKSKDEKGKETKNDLLSRIPDKSWLVGKGEPGHLALNYKIKIKTPTADPIRYVIGSYIPKHRQQEYQEQGFKILDKTPYFADNQGLKEGNTASIKQGLLYKEPLELSITCFVPGLLPKIVEEIPYVFAYENFGTRQSKGFGSFTPTSIRSAENFEDLLRVHEDYKEALKLTVKGDLYKAFQTIDSEYKILKGGFGKEESQMKLYFEDRGIEWEKEIIKRRLIGGRGNRKSDNYTNARDPKYVRVLLGLAELYEFPQKRAKVNIKPINNDIQRFRSPITVKIFQDRVGYHLYLLSPKALPQVILNAEYEFILNSQESITLKAPEEFDIKDFLQNHVDENWSYINE